MQFATKSTTLIFFNLLPFRYLSGGGVGLLTVLADDFQKFLAAVNFWHLDLTRPAKSMANHDWLFERDQSYVSVRAPGESQAELMQSPAARQRRGCC